MRYALIHDSSCLTVAGLVRLSWVLGEETVVVALRQASVLSGMMMSKTAQPHLPNYDKSQFRGLVEGESLVRGCVGQGMRQRRAEILGLLRDVTYL